MPELEPITREEKFLNGEVGMTPITREEKILAGEDVETITRREYFLKKYRGGGGGDITVEEITITENGTTTAPSGKAYSPIHTNVPQPTLSTLEVSENGDYDAPSGTAYNRVNVNVPLPQNAYLLKSVNTPTPIASFNDGEEMVMPSLKVAIEPQQDLSHGEPSPTNICPIIGWDECKVSVSGINQWDEEWEIISNILYSKNYIPVKPNTQYYMTPHQGRDYICLDSQFNVVRSWTWLSSLYPTFTTPSNCYYIKFRMTSDYGTTYNNDISINYPSTDTEYHAYNGSTYTIDLDGTRYGGEVDVVNGIVTPVPYYASYNGEALTGEWISDRDKYEVGATPTIGAQVVNIGASGTPVSILPTAIKSLRGVNNVWADTGDITDAEYFSKEV